MTCAKWPKYLRYGQRKGMENQNFLDAAVFTRLFHQRLVRFDRTACYIFKFGKLPKPLLPDAGAFAARLDRFLGALPRGQWR